jgi:hypothetical protein
MTTETNTPEANLAPRQQEIVDKAEQAAKKLGAGSHLQDWLDVAEGLVELRRIAMLRSSSNEPAGKKYAAAMSALLTAHPGLRALGQKDVVSKAIWLVDGEDRRQALAAIRQRMTPGQLARFNSPTTAYQRVKAELENAVKIAAAEDESNGDDGRAVVEAPAKVVKLTPTQLLQARIAELENDNLQLKGRLAALDNETIDLDGASVVKNFDMVVSRFPAKQANRKKLADMGKIIDTALVRMAADIKQAAVKVITPAQSKKLAKQAKLTGGAPL